VNNAGNGFGSNPEFARKFVHRVLVAVKSHERAWLIRIEHTDFLCRCCRQLTRTVTLPVFADAVCCIVGMGTKEKMGRSNTSRIIAAMADLQSLRNRSFVKLIRKTMSVPLTSEQSVSGRHRWTDPLPAPFRFSNAIPKICNRQLCWHDGRA
jgi:hypothetical protein